MSDEIKNKDEELLEEFETCSIDDLLKTIDELEGREPFSRSTSKEYESYLVDEDVSEFDVPKDIDSGEVVVKPVIRKRTRIKKHKDEKEETIGSIILGWVKVVVIAVVIALVINKFVIANALIPSGSMESTIMTGDRVIGLRTSYIFTSPERGDIVIFKNPDDESKLYIKRIIGVPGDKVEIVDGLVYINDSEEPLDESYLTVTPKGDFGPYEVPEESYFMLGDNRNVSKDSRYWENTFVNEEKIIAKAYLRYYPTWGLIK